MQEEAWLVDMLRRVLQVGHTAFILRHSLVCTTCVGGL